MNTDGKDISFIVLICCVFAFFIVICGKKEYKIVNKDTIKQEIKIELPQEEGIVINQKYNLDNIEYTKLLFKDITITSYNNHSNQTDNTPNITASNKVVKEGMVAISRDFLNKEKVRYGDLVFIDCMNQWYTIEDTMNKRFEKRIDIFLFDKEQSIKINKKCNIEIISFKR